MKVIWLLRGKAKARTVDTELKPFYARPDMVSHLLAPAAEAQLNTFFVESTGPNTKSLTTQPTSDEAKPSIMAKRGHWEVKSDAMWQVHIGQDSAAGNRDHLGFHAEWDLI